MVCELMPYSGGLTRNIVQCLDDFCIPLKLSTTVVATHGTDRLEGVTIAKVDDRLQPIPGTEEYVPCDTLMLSVGLIPENELSKNSGLQLDMITSGPKVDEYRETEHAGVFACGNVLQVHDLVDYVTEESQIAGLGAAKFIKGEKVTSECVYTQGIHGVRYIVPQRINRATDTDVKLYFRVGAVFNNARIIVECDGKEILSKKKVKLCPGEMEYVTLKQSVIAELPAEAVINVRVEA
ncbi:MAG: FAD-dependent oxidoreductase, partial [Clostridia bacterium]|nr:FAD-dependent oxidoreductase [Clostridia bacterium]